MELDLIKQQLEKLNNADVFRKNMEDEYRGLLSEMEKLGVPPQSATINEEDRDTPISCFVSTSEKDFITERLARNLYVNGIKTVGQFLDLNRIDALELNRIGPGKWKDLYKRQKELLYYLLGKSNDATDSSIHYETKTQTKTPTDVFVCSEIKKYSIDELKTINDNMLKYEISSLSGNFKNKSEYLLHNSEYLLLLAELNKRGQKRSSLFEDDEMSDIALDVLWHVLRSSRIKIYCECLGIQRLTQFLDITENDISTIRKAGKQVWKDVVDIKSRIIYNPQDFLDVYKKYYAIRELPDTEVDRPLYVKITSSLEILAEILDNRYKKRDAFIIRELFIKGTSRDNIGKNISKVGGASLTSSRVQQIEQNIRSKIMSGSENPVIDNVYFSDKMISELENLAEDILYCPLSYINNKLHAPDDYDPRPIIKLLGLELFECTEDRESYVDAPYIVGDTDSILKVKVHFQALNEVMKSSALPMSKDDIFSEILRSKTMTVECNIDLLEHILFHSTWIIHDNNDNYSYPYGKLGSAEDKAARIVYEKRNITTSDIIKLDKELGSNYKKDMPISFPKTNHKYPWVAKGARNDEWVYSPIRTSTLPSVREATEKYAQKHIIFKFSDMVKYLRSKGYDKYADGSFRTYVLKCCVPSNADTDLLCLESEVVNNDPAKWRSRTKSGITNWIINSCVKLLGDKKFKISELKKLILALKEAKDYNRRYIYNFSIYNYCCNENEYTKEKLFVVNEDGEIWLNQACIDEQLVDLDTIGSLNKQPDYYMVVLTEIVNQLKKADNHRLKLAKLSNICHHIIAPHANKNSFYKIIKKLPEEVERVDENGTVFLQLKPEKLTYEPSYSIPSNITNDVQDEIIAPQVVETSKPSQPNLRNNIDWIIMTKDLKSELGYYDRWWDINSKKTIGLAIEDFVRFLESTDDSILHNHVSRHIYEFLTLKLDRYDLHDHLTVISANLESLIRKVYMLNNHCQDTPPTKGLVDCIALIPELQDWLKTADRSQDFAKIYNQFWKCRNKILHGVDVQMNTVNKYQSIYSFIALYIYIYTRFTQ